MTRYHRSPIQELSRGVKRIQKIFEGANIRLSNVATDITGVSGRTIMKTTVSGVDDPVKRADMAKGRMRKKKGTLEKALNRLIGNYSKMMLKNQLRYLDFLDSEIAQLDKKTGSRQ